MNRRLFLVLAVTTGSVLVATGLLGCGGSGSSRGALTETNPYPLSGFYEGTYIRTVDGNTRSGTAQLRLYGLEDRQPAVVAGDVEYSPAIIPGAVQGIFAPTPNPTGSDYYQTLVGGQITGGNYLKIGFSDGKTNEYAEGSLSYNSDTKILTATFLVTITPGTISTDTAEGTISFILTKK